MIRKALVAAAVIVVTLYVFLYPDLSASWVSEGFESFSKRLFPYTFLPMVLSAFVYHSPLRAPLGRLCSGVLGPLFKTKEEESLVVLFSFLCGYPTGILLAKSLWEEKRISLEGFQRLSLFCNNCGVGFTFSYLSALYSPSTALGIFLSQLCACLVLCRIAPSVAGTSPPPLATEEERDFVQAFCVGMKKTLSSLCYTGGFVIFFSFVTQMLSQLFHQSDPYFPLLLHLFLELSSACGAIRAFDAPALFCAVAVGWSGLCVWAQSRMAAHPLPLARHYFIYKGVNALLCGIFFLLFSFIIL